MPELPGGPVTPGTAPRGNPALVLVATPTEAGQVRVRATWTIDPLRHEREEEVLRPDEVVDLVQRWLAESRRRLSMRDV